MVRVAPSRRPICVNAKSISRPDRLSPGIGNVAITALRGLTLRDSTSFLPRFDSALKKGRSAKVPSVPFNL